MYIIVVLLLLLVPLTHSTQIHTHLRPLCGLQVINKWYTPVILYTLFSWLVSLLQYCVGYLVYTAGREDGQCVVSPQGDSPEFLG